MPAAVMTLVSTPLDSAPGSFTFQSFLTPDGWASYIAEKISEEMTTPGVSGKRWRTIFEQVPPIAARCISQQSDYATAVAVAAQLRAARCRFANVVLTVGTLTVNLLVYISEAPSVALPGPVAAAEGGQTASGVLCEFSLEVIEGSGVAGF